MMKTIHSDEGLTDAGKMPSIFLAGPSPRGYGEGFPKDWRDDAMAIFRDLGFDGQLFIPRPTTGNASDYDGQIEWELHHLDVAKCVMFWVPRDLKTLPAFTTNCEFGLYAKSGKVIYGRPDSAPKNRYLDHIYRKFTSLEPKKTLIETVKDSIQMADHMVTVIS